MSEFLCEICHAHPAKHQWFDKNEQELYICSECFNQRQIGWVAEMLSRDTKLATNSIVAMKTILTMFKAIKCSRQFSYADTCGEDEFRAHGELNNEARTVSLDFSASSGQASRWLFKLNPNSSVDMDVDLTFEDGTSCALSSAVNEIPTEVYKLFIGIISGMAGSRDKITLN